MGKVFKYVLVIAILLWLWLGTITMLVTRSDPNYDRREAVRQGAMRDTQNQDSLVTLALVGAGNLKKSMRNPDSFKLESAMLIRRTATICYEYRAQNGFGGINKGYAVFSDGRLLTSEHDGFFRLWKKECAGQAGEEVSRRLIIF